MKILWSALLHRATIINKKLKPGLVASYDIWPGNRQGLVLFWCFINLLLTYLLTHLPTYLQPRNPHGAFSKWTWTSWLPHQPSTPLVLAEPLETCGTGFQIGCPPSHATNNVMALKGTAKALKDTSGQTFISHEHNCWLHLDNKVRLCNLKCMQQL